MDSINLDIAEVLLRKLTRYGENTLLSYSELSDCINHEILNRNLGDYLAQVCRMSHSFGAPMLTAIVVHKDNKMPGQRFFDLYEEIYAKKVTDKDKVFIEELNKVYCYNKWTEFAKSIGINLNQ